MGTIAAPRRSIFAARDTSHAVPAAPSTTNVPVDDNRREDGSTSLLLFPLVFLNPFRRFYLGLLFLEFACEDARIFEFTA
jgi:hypothetical protein